MKRLFLLLLFTASLLRSEDIYIAQTAQGSDSGTDPANAHSIVWFNTAGNWSSPTKVSGKIGPGDTAHFCSTISSSAFVQASGTSGNVITFVWESGAKFSSPAFATSAGINATAKNHLTFDGGANGVIENTANGTNLANKIASYGMKLLSCSNLTVKNLTIQNIYVRVAGSDLSGGAANGGSAAIVCNATGAAQTNILIQNNTIHDAFCGIDMDYGSGCSNYEVTGNTVYNCNWGGRCGDRQSNCDLNGLSVHDNTFKEWTNWDSPTDLGLHHNGFYAWADQSGTGGITNMTFYNNVVGPNFSNSLSGYNASTSGLFFSGKLVGPTYIYNNLFVNNVGGGPANGLITFGTNLSCTLVIANNTFLGSNGAQDVNFSGSSPVVLTVVLNNNIFSGADVAVSCLYNSGVSLTSNHNLGYGLVSAPFKWASGGSGAGITLAAWQTATGQDADIITSNPSLDGTYHLQAGSPAIAAGATLSTYFTTDKSGLTRTVPWDLGAYKFVGSNVAPVITLNPVTQSVLSGANVTFTATASGTPPPTWQWNKDASPIGGATSSTLVLFGVTSGDNGTYTATATNAAGSATSSGAVLTVTTSTTTGTPGTPVITGILP